MSSGLEIIRETRPTRLDTFRFHHNHERREGVQGSALAPPPPTFLKKKLNDIENISLYIIAYIMYLWHLYFK